MFPLEFAFDVVNRFSKPGGACDIIDPFAGRCSSIYAGGVLGRNSLGIEINPVGWLYGRVKLYPAEKDSVIDRLLDLYGQRYNYVDEVKALPEFITSAFVTKCFIFCWPQRPIKLATRFSDATLMSIILLYLHGKVGAALSNQMRMTKSMGMNYSPMVEG